MTSDWASPNILLGAGLVGGTVSALAGFWMHLALHVLGATGDAITYATIICTFAGPLTAAWVYNRLEQRASRKAEPQAAGIAAELSGGTSEPTHAADGPGMSKPPEPPSCPRCTKLMLAVLTVPPFADRRRLESYACRPCLEVVTVEAVQAT